MNTMKTKTTMGSKKNIKRCTTMIAAVMLAFASPVTVDAYVDSGAKSSRSDEEIRVYTDGMPYEGEVRLVRERAYVSLREFACTVDNAIVSWDEERSSASVVTDTLELEAGEGDNYMMANGRYLWCSEGIFTDDGVIYVPLQQLAKAFGFDNNWDYEENANYLIRKYSAIEEAETFYDADELYWLSRIINAESGGEPFKGKLAVGTVILNRVADDEFPDELYDVIFDNDCGVQFTPTVNGTIDREPNEESVIAAKLCLEGYRLSDEILYFLNPDIATNFWIVENCTFVISIGGHDFYA